jgi:hypothetical protein
VHLDKSPTKFKTFPGTFSFSWPFLNLGKSSKRLKSFTSRDKWKFTFPSKIKLWLRNGTKISKFCIKKKWTLTYFCQNLINLKNRDSAALQASQKYLFNDLERLYMTIFLTLWMVKLLTERKASTTKSFLSLSFGSCYLLFFNLQSWCIKTGRKLAIFVPKIFITTRKSS